MNKTHMNEMMKLDNQMCFPLYAAARKVTGLYTPWLKELGITYTQYIVFMVLWENDGISVGELGRKLYLDNGTLTPLLKKMQDKGYLTRVRSKEDERVVIVTLTDEGWALREKVLSIPESVGSCVPLSEEEARTLYSLLYRVIDGMER